MVMVWIMIMVGIMMMVWLWWWCGVEIYILKYAKAADMLKEAGAKRVIGKSSATIHFWYEGFSCTGFQGRKSLSSSWFNLCKALSRMESCLDQLFRWVSSYSYSSCWLASYKFRPKRWIVTIPSSDQWLATIGNHWKTIATNGFGDQKPLTNHC